MSTEPLASSRVNTTKVVCIYQLVGIGHINTVYLLSVVDNDDSLPSKA
jgi:hypothetical protein